MPLIRLDCDAMQPGGKSAVAAKLAELVPRLDESFLGAILSFGDIARHSQAQPVNLVDMQAIQLLKRACVGPLRPGDPVSFVVYPGLV
jgi:hypothetical protein